MGCWNETCGLSHLQICYRDKIKFLILFEVTKDTRTCYYNESYAPLCLPMIGEYNDYGGVENIEVPEYTLNFLSKLKYFTKEIDEDSEEEIFKEYEFKDVETLIYDIMDKENIYFDYGVGKNSKRRLTYIYYHKELYDILVEDFKKRKVYEHKENIYELYVKKYEKNKEEILKIIELKNEKIKNPSNKDILYDLMDLKLNMRDKIFKSSQYSFSFPVQYINMDILEENTIDDFINELIDYIMFARSLEFGRYGFYSICGAGGQDLDVRVQELIAKFVLEFIKRKNEDGDKIYTKNETIFWWED